MNPDNPTIVSSTEHDNLPSRRSAIKTVSAVVATAGLASFANTHRSTAAEAIPAVHNSVDDIIKVGLVGCGGRGTGAAVNSMNADKGVRIVALADLFDASIENCRKSLQGRYKDQFAVEDDHCFTGFDNYKRLLETDIDVVLLASPPHYRPDQMEAAVAAGKQIFCEKPVATDPAGVRRVEAACRAADEKGLNVVSGLCWRYDEGLKQTMQRVHDGAIGNVISSQFDYLTSPVWIRNRKEGESEMEYQCRNWYYFTWLSGDHYVEQFIHSLDKALWLHHDEPPVKAYGLGGRQRRSDLNQGNIYDHFAVVYEWADGTRAFANTRQIKGCMNQTEDFVFGSEGSAQLIRHEIDGRTPWKFTDQKVQMHQAEQDELYKAIRGQRERINNGTYMCRSTMMAIMGREVTYCGKELSYEQVATSPMDLRPNAYEFGDAPEVVIAQPGEYEFPLA
ncbi:Gfo/Idh/MocA family protein [Neorhodopirellula pilleata]|uniref:Inositol 2-dehydrogenase n=1 Tax=Neorhodopirellula pilleata TaxID=2714738 RepID=A0A5C6A8B5_9BACT|nr:Gfo/Idh/MocA family oxidoreductase [Neorhodopirellula pilleata]TWT95789.1 Inositol 2-dehydrogenase [Neorhodopirellula pilleata]